MFDFPAITDLANQVGKDNHQSLAFIGKFSWKRVCRSEVWIFIMSPVVDGVSLRLELHAGRCLPVASSRLRFAAVFTRSVEVLLALAVSTRPQTNLRSPEIQTGDEKDASYQMHLGSNYV